MCDSSELCGRRRSAALRKLRIKKMVQSAEGVVGEVVVQRFEHSQFHLAVCFKRPIFSSIGLVVTLSFAPLAAVVVFVENVVDNVANRLREVVKRQPSVLSNSHIQ